MRRSLLPLLQTFIVAVLSVGSAAFAAVGRTQGAAEVSLNGAATYTIPIFAPAGTAGLTPDLAFVYSSNSGNGALGVGWGLAGLSRIERCPATFASNNGNPGDVRGDSLDRFCRDGNQLKYFGGSPYGQAGTEYRTELDMMARIRSYGSAGTGPAYFIVEQKDGLIYEYGNTSDSRIEWLGSANARTWAVNKIRDRSGNAILFNYSEDGVNGGYRISSIQYTSNAMQGITPPYQISFVYEAMPSGEVDSGFMGNGLIKRMTRLDRVDVAYSGALVRRYELTFESTLSSTSRSRLQSIQECSGPTLDCLPATTFTYQNGVNALNPEYNTGVTVNSNSGVRPMDINGDGRSDLVFSSCSAGQPGTWMSSLANPDGSYAPPVNSGVAVLCQLPIRIDYNADGRDDLLYSNGGPLSVLLGTTQGLSTQPIDTGAPPYTLTSPRSSPRMLAADMNGDGLEDLVYGNSYSIEYRLRQLGGTFSATAVNLLSSADVNVTFQLDLVNDATIDRPDFNGDGRTDVVVRIATHVGQETYHTGTKIFLSGQSNPIDLPPTGGTFASFADINGDGLTDILVSHFGQWRYRLSRGLSFGPELTQTFSPAAFPLSAVLDWDGDGFDDVVSRFPDGTLQVMRSNGEMLQSYVTVGQVNPFPGQLLAADANGDGLRDVIFYSFSNTTPAPVRVLLRTGPAPDLLQTATDGFGVSTTFSYASTGNYNLFQRSSWSGFVYPIQDSSAPMHVVSNVQASNGIGGTYNLQDFSYEGARLNLHGRGFLGFAARSWVDSRTGVRQRLEYLQNFPLVGQVTKSQSTKVSSGTVFNEVQTTYQSLNTGGVEHSRSLFNILRVTQTDRELGGAYNGTVVRTAVTSNTMDWNTGTVYDSTTVITEGTNANGLNPGQTYTQRTLLPLANMFTDTANWCIARPGQVQQIGSHSLFGGNSVTRTVNTSWDGPACRATQTVIEPGNATLQVTTDLSYDSFGNLAQQSVTPVNEAVRVSQLNWGTDGRFPRTLTNPLSQATTADWWPELGLLKSVTDPNGLTASSTYDSFGRPVTSIAPDGTSTLTEYLLCDADCTGFANTQQKIRSTFRDTAGGTISQGFVLLDAFDRVRRASSYALEGGLINRLVEYDAAGRVLRTSTPYFNFSGTPVWTTFLYDPIGRQIQATRDRVSDNDGSTAISTTQYDGLSITSTDPQGKIRVDKLSPLGQIVRAIQASGTGDETQASYDYDAFGNVLRVTDAASNQTVIGYNIRGFKTSSSDPDMGTWTYDYYALGELKQQTDAKLQVTSFTYDKLSRPLTRVEPSDSGSGTQTTTWTWGTSAANFNIGQLESIGKTGYAEQNRYDNRSRLILKQIVADGGFYEFSQSYNPTTGLLETITYPTSHGPAPFKVKYEYETANKSGLVQRIKDYHAGIVFWQATSTNAFGQYQDITLGNGLKTLTAFDSVTGATNRIETGPAGGNNRQHLQYVWDKVGNLASRQDLNISKLETFTYDNLYRLTQAAVTGGTPLTVAYNALGNITSKSDVGAYTYDPVKKHAVTAAGSYSFTYDPNGNAITQNGATISWTAYNLPKLINQSGGNNSQFLYGPDRQRYKHVAVNGATSETTIYVGGIFEKLTRNGTVEYKHSVVGPNSVVAIHNRKSTGVNETIYPLQDHLGSTDVVTDASGASLVKLSFTPFGARRNGATWSGAPSAADLAAIADTTRRGFTEHEQLDNLGLIHMNGRVYHPVVGRFISADPFVQAPFNTQSLNRYSYVFNNPLSFTDPSGFACAERVFLPTRLEASGGGGGDSGGCNDNEGLSFLSPLFGGGGGLGNFGGTTIGPKPQPEFFPVPQPTAPSPGPTAPSPGPTAPSPGPAPQPEPTMGPRMPPMVDMGGQVTRNNGEGWMKSGPGLGRIGVSVLVGSLPVLGSGQAIVELVSGRDYITGEETSRVLAAVGIFAGLVGAKGLLKAATKADDIAEGVTDIAARAGGGRVLVDSSLVAALPKDPTLSGRIAVGEEAVVSFVTRPELRNKVALNARNGLKNSKLRGVPHVLDKIPTLSTRPNIDTVVTIRGQLLKKKGKFGDGVIGAQAVDLNIPLITNDRELARIVRELGGIVR